MKYATVSLPDGNYTETDQTWILINGKEAKILIDAVEEYSTTHKRSKLAKKMLTELDKIPCSLDKTLAKETHEIYNSSRGQLYPSVVHVLI